MAATSRGWALTAKSSVTMAAARPRRLYRRQSSRAWLMNIVMVFRRVASTRLVINQDLSRRSSCVVSFKGGGAERTSGVRGQYCNFLTNFVYFIPLRHGGCSADGSEFRGRNGTNHSVKDEKAKKTIFNQFFFVFLKWPTIPRNVLILFLLVKHILEAKIFVISLLFQPLTPGDKWERFPIKSGLQEISSRRWKPLNRLTEGYQWGCHLLSLSFTLIPRLLLN